MAVQGSQKIRNFKPDQMLVSEWRTMVKKYVILTKNLNKSVKYHQKTSSKNRFFVKTTYSQLPGNHSEHPIGSGMKFLICRDPQTAIWGKIGGFCFKSPHREQILLLLLRSLEQFIQTLKGQNSFGNKIPFFGNRMLF